MNIRRNDAHDWLMDILAKNTMPAEIVACFHLLAAHIVHGNGLEFVRHAQAYDGNLVKVNVGGTVKEGTQ